MSSFNHYGNYESFENSLEDFNLNSLTREDSLKHVTGNQNDEINVNYTQKVDINEATKGHEQITTIRFGHNIGEGLSQIKDIMMTDRDIKLISILFYDHEKHKVIKIQVKNEKNQAHKALVAKIQKKKISKKKRQEPTEKRNNYQKNGPKLFGKAMIDFFYERENYPILESFIKKYTLKHPTVFLEIQDLHDWIQKHCLTACFNNIQAFRQFWTIKETGSQKEDFKALTFRDVCHHFLKNEAARLVFNKCFRNVNKKMKLDNAAAFLGILPILIKGVLNPQNFHSLK